MTTTTITPMSPAQSAFIRNLLAEKAGLPAAEAVRESLNAARTAGTLTTEVAKSAITSLLAVQAPQPELGVYVMADGTIVKAQPNKAKTNVYTMKWVEIGGERLVDATEERVHGEWEYAPEYKSAIPTARKMTLDEARDFILRYGKCVRCSRRLKAADSVDRGIGPVCVQYFGGF